MTEKNKSKTAFIVTMIVIIIMLWKKAKEPKGTYVPEDGSFGRFDSDGDFDQWEGAVFVDKEHMPKMATPGYTAAFNLNATIIPDNTNLKYGENCTDCKG